MSTQMNVAFSTDSNYLIPATVAITSFLENHKDVEIILFLLYINDGSLKEEDLKSLEKLVSSYGATFQPLEIEKEMLSSMPRLRHGLSTYLRIFLPCILSDIDKILYLDVDIVVQKNLNELYSVNMKNYQVAAVADLKPLYNPDYLKQIGYYRNEKYFCAGILLMNLAELRKIDLVKETMKYLEVYRDKIAHSDQDILNVICDKVYYLPPKYNFVEGYNSKKCLSLWDKKSLKEALVSPAIIHYLGPSKPWHYLNMHPYKKEWDKYLKKTSYHNYIPTDKVFINKIKLQIRTMKRWLKRIFKMIIKKEEIIQSI